MISRSRIIELTSKNTNRFKKIKLPNSSTFSQPTYYDIKKIELTYQKKLQEKLESHSPFNEIVSGQKNSLQDTYQSMEKVNENQQDEKNKRYLDQPDIDYESYIQFSENLFPNIFHLEGANFKTVKIDVIRKLKSDLQKTSLNKGKRFIILDDVEIFNINSLNGLLKIIEEPSSNDHFILINNKSQKLLETVKSRCLEIKILLDEITRKKTLSILLNKFKQHDILNFNTNSASPGNYLKFNYFFSEMSLNKEESLYNNFKKILSFYKKDKNILYKDFLLFLVDFYIQKDNLRKNQSLQLLIDKRSLIMKNINNFFVHNLSSNTFLNSIEGKTE